MNDTPNNVDPENKGHAIFDEADIGSGERSPGQHDTEQMIREIPPLPPAGSDDKQDNEEGKRQETGA
ncbi:hypothetical protein RCH14_003918 [Massilia sp. MP_M2]|uniref:hypothetical protein n=1 Tax=Massilia sp. MP_M2 TaxID=3071713 RepID=UPI00319DABA0